MTNTELIQKIRAEIERLKKNNEVFEDKDYAQYELDGSCGYNEALNDMLSFLSSLELEKPMNQEGLEKEINLYFNAWQNVLCDEDCCNEGGFCCVLNDELKPVSLFHCRKIARHFAQWGAEHRGSSEIPNDLEEAAKEHVKTLHDIEGCEVGMCRRIFIAGAKWDREQMMKEAVEERVQRSPLNGPLGISAYCCNFPSNHPFYHCKDGDKVRIIIVKDR